jgi:hypothetical protein
MAESFRCLDRLTTMQNELRRLMHEHRGLTITELSAMTGRSEQSIRNELRGPFRKPQRLAYIHEWRWELRGHLHRWVQVWRTGCSKDAPKPPRSTNTERVRRYDEKCRAILGPSYRSSRQGRRLVAFIRSKAAQERACP